MDNYTKLFNEKTKKLDPEFVLQFSKYLDSNDNDFIINVNDIWNWLGFTNKENCIRAISKFFTESIDYIIEPSLHNVTVSTNSSTSLQKVLLITVPVFKKLCIQINTNEGDSIYNCYCKLEQMYREVLEEKIYDNYFFS